MDNNRPQSYVQRFLAVSSQMERFFFRLAAVGFIGILASQLLLSSHWLRTLITRVDVLEGQQIPNNQKAAATTQVSRELLIQPVTKLAKPGWIKLNGVPVAQILSEQVSITVNNGDKLEITTQQDTGLAEFAIDHNDPAITSPAPGTHVETSDSHSALIGPILFQR